MAYQNKELMELEDKLGYIVDQDEIQQEEQTRKSRIPPTYNNATASTFHTEIKQPTPVKPVQFPMDNSKQRSSTTTTLEPESSRDSSYGPTQQPINSTDAPPLDSRSNKGKERDHHASSTETTNYTREEIENLLYRKMQECQELSNKLRHIEDPMLQRTNNQGRMYEHPPEPVPSRSDPNNYYPPLRKGKMNAYAYPSSGNGRNLYNKSADMASYQEYNDIGVYGSSSSSSRKYPAQRHDNSALYDDNVYYDHHHHPQQPSYYQYPYDNYYSAREMAHEWYYGRASPPRYHDGNQRRKSFSNLQEEQYKLKSMGGSRGNMKKDVAPQPQPMYYNYASPPPPPPPPHPIYYDGKQRRKSFSNLQEEQYKLKKRGSRGNMKKDATPQPQQMYYNYASPPQHRRPYE